MMVDDIRMAKVLFSELSEAAFRDRDGTIYGFFHEHFRAALGLPSGARCCASRATAFTYGDVPVETRVRHVNTARLAYLSQLGRH